MCGILAGSGKIKPEIIAALGCLNSSRGRDSAGIAWFEGEKIRLKKKAADPVVVFSVDLKDEIERAAQAKNVIGHTRAATHGATNAANAHPFFMEGIAFAHNGVIGNYLQFGQYEVDSQALIHGIIKKDFSEYQGSIALVWIEDGKIHAFRKGNPIFRGVMGGALYLSSEDDDLKAVGCEKVRELSEGHIYVIDKGGIVGSKRVPANQGYQPTVTHYPSFSSTYSHRRWIGGKWVEAEEPPKPNPTTLCECSHAGERHTHVNSTTNAWACYAKRDQNDEKSIICSCNEFRPKEEAPRQMELVTTRGTRLMCVCKHGLMRHSMRNTQQSCDVNRCPCGNYREAQIEAEDDNAPDVWNCGVENMPPKTMCECEHELEYHFEGGLHCQVSMCTCKWFWPKIYNEQPEQLESNFR